MLILASEISNTWPVELPLKRAEVPLTGTSGQIAGTSGHPKFTKKVLQKLPYLLNPDSDFDVLGLVEITATSPSTICIETS